MNLRHRLSQNSISYLEPRVLLVGEAAEQQVQSIVQTLPTGKEWRDTNGNVIDAHGATFNQVGDYYYMFGTARQNPERSAETFFQAIKVYRSKDLVNWEFIRDAVTQDQLGVSEDKKGIQNGSRPNVVYNEKLGKWVMFMKHKTKDLKKPAILTSDTIDGPYTFVKHLETAQGEAGGQHVFQDKDGTAYIVYSEQASEDGHEGRSLVIDRLSDDYMTSVESRRVLDATREGPAMFEANGTYYIIHSGTTSWGPNQLMYQTASDPMGEWSSPKLIGNGSGFRSQPNDILEIHGTEGSTYVYTGDRHIQRYLGDSTNVWLPLEFNGTEISMEYRDSFEIDLQAGQWKATRSSREVSSNAATALAEEIKGLIVELPERILVHIRAEVDRDQFEGNNAVLDSPENVVAFSTQPNLEMVSEINRAIDQLVLQDFDERLQDLKPFVEHMIRIEPIWQAIDRFFEAEDRDNLEQLFTRISHGRVRKIGNSDKALINGRDNTLEYLIAAAKQLDTQSLMETEDFLESLDSEPTV